MIDLTLSEHDKAHPLWQRLRLHLEDRLDDLRVRNDVNQTEQSTATLRGEIKCLKKLIALGADRPMTD